MRHLKSVLMVVGAALVVLLAGNTIAIAATGQGLVLGRSNAANKVTTVTRTTSGPVLAVKTRTSSGTPLVVNGRGKVANLNADSVDGFDSTAMRDRTYLWTRNVTSGEDTLDLDLSGLPAGTYEVGYSVYPQFTSVPTGTTITCALEVLDDEDLPVRRVGANRSSAPEVNATPSVSGSAVVVLGAAQSVQLACFGSTAFGTFANQPVQVFASPTSVVAHSSNVRR